MADVQDRFSLAIEGFDAANAQDPKGAELLYGQRMTGWLERLYPDASEELRLACRAQHIRRWEIPRNSFPMDRVGYHRWRTRLYTFHADTAEKILRSVGYDDAVVGRVRSLIKKERLKADPQTQALEDVACMVFLENYFADFAPKHDEEKVVTILRKTWGKMSEKAREAALQLELPPMAKGLVERALHP
jgi:Domain of unknown function (DUF4202)